MTKFEEKISVVCCNHNHAQYIEQAVLSVLNQTYENIELIIVDDGSTDISKDVIERLTKLDKRITKPIYLEQNKGKWFALNVGISTATGTLVTLQDADDYSNVYRLERQHKVLKEQKSFHNLCGFSHCYNQQDIEKVATWTPPANYEVIAHKDVVSLVYQGFKTEGINHYYMGNYEIHGASALWYKQLSDNGIKFLPGNMGLRIQKAEDGDFNTKMTLLFQKTSVLKEPLYAYRRNTSTNNAFLENC